MNLSVKNLVLNYSYKSVLKDLSVDFSEGQIHAVLGENGAGKSTLAKIISGELLPNNGSIFCDTKQLYPSKNFSVKKSIENGICYVHQRPLLAESISIYENVILGLNKIEKNKILHLINQWLPDYSPQTLVKDVGGDCNFFTALICALLKNPKILILDEPCALLNESQTEFLYSKLQNLKRQGLNIIVITHSKKEAENYCDTITVLDNGKILFQNKTNSENPLKNFGLSFLENNWKHSPENSNNKSTEEILSPIRLSFSNINCHPVNKPGISNINFTAYGKQITLISGLSEDGLETLENVITGMEKSKFNGKLEIDDLTVGNNRHFSLAIKNSNFNSMLLRNGTGFSTAIIPSDKNFRASNPNLTIKQILSFSPLTPEELISSAQINISKNEKVSCLSGGMLQRLILQRELSLNPEILIFCEPLQGLDFATSEKICKTLTDLANSGKLILILASSEFPENYCSKKYILKAGKLSPAELQNSFKGEK